jgi:putative oxidoreductase
MSDLGLCMLRLLLGGLLMGHGAQKLFGAFEGHGLKGTAGMFGRLGLRPGEHPLGPISTIGPMIVAWGRAHWGKPIWITSGGGELPLTNLGIAAALVLTGPGSLSVDRAFGIRVPAAIAALFAACVAGSTVMALSQPRPAPHAQAAPARASAAVEAEAST